MKYYINGKLVRTSNHHYEYAIVQSKTKVIACCGNLDLAQKRLFQEMKYRLEKFEIMQRMVKESDKSKEEKEKLLSYLKTQVEILASGNAFEIVRLETRGAE